MAYFPRQPRWASINILYFNEAQDNGAPVASGGHWLLVWKTWTSQGIRDRSAKSQGFDKKLGKGQKRMRAGNCISWTSVLASDWRLTGILMCYSLTTVIGEYFVSVAWSLEQLGKSHGICAVSESVTMYTVLLKRARDCAEFSVSFSSCCECCRIWQVCG